MNRIANDTDTQRFIHLFEAEVPASKTDGGYPFFGAAEDWYGISACPVFVAMVSSF